MWLLKPVYLLTCMYHTIKKNKILFMKRSQERKLLRFELIRGETGHKIKSTIINFL